MNCKIWIQGNSLQAQRNDPNHFDATSLPDPQSPSDFVNATECVLRSLCLVHNLVQHFQDKIGLRPADAPKDQGKRYMLETQRNTLFSCSAYLGKSGRDKVLRLSSTDPCLEGRFV